MYGLRASEMSYLIPACDGKSKHFSSASKRKPLQLTGE